MNWSTKMKKAFIIILCSFFIANTTLAKTQNWCGTYVEIKNKGYLKILPSDMNNNKNKCDPIKYKQNHKDPRIANILLEFNNNTSTLNNWKKFDGHLIEIKGKLKYGFSHNMKYGIFHEIKFVRDYGF